MYRIAVCEDDPRTAEQNKAAACRALDQKDRVRCNGGKAMFLFS